MMYKVENGNVVWGVYDNREHAEEIVRYLNRYYNNGYYVTEVKEGA